MLPGWMRPIDRVTDMLLRTTPQEASRQLAVLPPDRFRAAVEGMRPADFARILTAARPEDRDGITAMLPRDRIPAVLRSVPRDQAAAMFSALPTHRMIRVMEELNAAEIALLMEAMPDERRAPLVDALAPEQVEIIQTMLYERQIAQVFSRTRIPVTSPEDGPGGPLMAAVYGRHILISAHHLERDFTLEELRRAEDAARRWRANGVLAITNAPLSNQAVEHVREAARQGWPVDVVTWTDPIQDGAMLRALVGLIR